MNRIDQEANMNSTTVARPDLDIDGAHYTWVGYSDDGDAHTGGRS